MRKFYEIYYIDDKDNKKKCVRYYCNSESDALRLFNSERITWKEIAAIEEKDSYKTP